MIMVTYPSTAGGYEVLVNGKPFGWISKERGFFTDPTRLNTFIEVLPSDLRRIADAIEKVRAGNLP